MDLSRAWDHSHHFPWMPGTSRAINDPLPPALPLPPTPGTCPGLYSTYFRTVLYVRLIYCTICTYSPFGIAQNGLVSAFCWHLLQEHIQVYGFLAVRSVVVHVYWGYEVLRVYW